jgi:putative ABC transport system permease protein
VRLPFFLAVRNLLRFPGRNILYTLGISITAALLLDMILLSSGLSLSLEKVLKELRYEVRASARGTLPFETETQIKHFSQIQGKLKQYPEIETVDALLGTTAAIQKGMDHFTCFALGMKQDRAVGYRITDGRDIQNTADEILVNSYLAEAKNIRPGDVLRVSIPTLSQTTGSLDAERVTVAGIASFYLDAEGQFSIACSLRLLQGLMLQTSEDPVSVILIKLHKSDDAVRVAEKMNAEFPQLSAYTIRSVIREVDQQLSYFKQFAYILGGISLVVTFVLVFIITTISFHDRLGEIALLKAIGLGSQTIFSTILIEGMLTSLASAIFGFFLGKIVAIYLDYILTSAPGLPQDFSFFVFHAPSIIRGIAILMLTGLFAGMYPAAAAIRLPVAETLREEIL